MIFSNRRIRKAQESSRIRETFEGKLRGRVDSLVADSSVWSSWRLAVEVKHVELKKCPKKTAADDQVSSVFFIRAVAATL